MAAQDTYLHGLPQGGLLISRMKAREVCGAQSCVDISYKDDTIQYKTATHCVITVPCPFERECGPGLVCKYSRIPGKVTSGLDPREGCLWMTGDSLPCDGEGRQADITRDRSILPA